MGYTTTGGPKGLGQFNTTPQTVADLNKLVELIARVGNFLGAVSESERDAITGGALYEGLMLLNTTSGRVESYDGAGWEPINQGSPVELTVFGSNWSATPSYEPVVVESGGMVHLLGAARIAQGGSMSNILTIPAGLRPAKQYFLGHYRTTSGTASGQLHIDTTGVVSAPDNYRTGSMAAGNSIPLTGSWPKG